MIVECPACHTRYRTDSVVVAEESPLFECSQEECGHVFSLPTSPPPWEDEDIQEERPEQSPADPIPTELSISPDEELEGGAIPRQKNPGAGKFARPAGSPSPAVPSRTATDDIEDFALPDEQFPEEPEEDPVEAHPLRFSPEENDEGEELTIPTRTGPKPPAEIPLSLMPLLLFLGSIVVGHGCLYVYFLFHPPAAEALLARVPVLGSLFVADQFSAHHVSLTAMRGGFWVTKDNRRVFAVSGTVTNHAPVPAYGVQLEGAIYNGGGKQVGRQTVFCGTETSPAALPGLTAREIGILQNLMPPKQFNVGAGRSVNFSIVFTNPPQTVTEFSSRVAAARFVAP